MSFEPPRRAGEGKPALVAGAFLIQQHQGDFEKGMI